MNRNLRIVVCLVVALATMALLSGIGHPAQAEHSVLLGFTSTPTSGPEETEPPPTEEPPTEKPPTEEPPTEEPPTEEPPTEEPPASTPKPERTREEGEPPAAAPTATLSPTLAATPVATVTLAPTQSVTPEPPSTGGLLNPLMVLWVAILIGLGLVALVHAVLRRVA